MRIPLRNLLSAGAILIGSLAVSSVAVAQGYMPLNQNSPPGMAGRWAAALGRATPLYLQPVKVILPSKGSVTFYDVSRRKQHAKSAPASARMGVGFVFRFRITVDKTETSPAATLYPSIELIDRLHPPLGQADKFPLPVRFTSQEIELALAGKMVTKVVYLEQPQLALPTSDPLPSATIAPDQNLIKEADRRGRPMAIIRLGGRQPDNGEEWRFIGRGGPIQVTNAR